MRRVTNTRAGPIGMAGDLARARVEEIVQVLRAHGHRLTPQRLAVVRVLVSSTDHPSAQQVYDRLQSDYPMMSPATVYKAIDALKATGQVRELEFREGPNRYEAHIPISHPHLVCTACGRIEDVDVDSLPELVEPVLRASQFRLLRYRFELFGLCAACQISTN